MQDRDVCSGRSRSPGGTRSVIRLLEGPAQPRSTVPFRPTVRRKRQRFERPRRSHAMATKNTATLSRLGATGQTVADPAEDIRGRRVKDKDGDDIGKVADLLIDDQDRKVRFLRVEHGGILGFGATASFIPVDAISRITDDDVYITQPSQHVADAPGYDPDLEDEMDYYGNIYGYYGQGHPCLLYTSPSPRDRTRSRMPS